MTQKFLKINEIIIGDRIRKDLGDIDQLANSINEIELLHPIVVHEKNKKFFLLAGHRRIEAFKKLGRESISANIVKLDDVLKAELHENQIRKEFTFSEMCVIDDAIAPEIKKHAEERMKSGKPSAKLAEGQKGDSRDKMASYLGMSHGQYDKFQKIKTAIKENPKKFTDIPERIDNGMSIDYASKMINTTERATTPTPDLPDDEFELLYFDLPWAYDLPLTGSPDYKTLTLEEIMNEFPKLPLTNDAIVFMWVTNPKLMEAMELIKFWGLDYKTNIVWVKAKNRIHAKVLEFKDKFYEFLHKNLQVGTGYYVKGSHELLLIVTRGSPGVPQEKDRVPSVVFAERTKLHSEKPKIFRKIINEMYPAKKKLEMFNREKDEYDNDTWSYYGDESSE